MTLLACRDHEKRIANLEDLLEKVISLNTTIATVVKNQSVTSDDLTGKIAALTLPPATGEIGEPYHR